MKKKVLTLSVFAILIIALIVLTGCGESKKKSNKNIAKEIETAVKSSIEKTVESDKRILIKNLQKNLDERFTILGVSTSSGAGIKSVKEYIDPSEEIPADQLSLSLTDNADFLIIYDSESKKEYRVGVFRQANPPIVTCDDDAEITK